MARVTVEDCVDKIPNRFDLVMLAAQRAREISAGAQLTIERDNDKNPVVALREIADETVVLAQLNDNLITGLQRHVENDEPEEEGTGFGTGAGDLLAEMQQAQISDDEAEEADMAIDGDQGGSIRMPSAWSGIVGHKPTYGLVTYTGAFPIERTIDHVGPMANNVRDEAAMLDVIAGADGLDSRQKSPPAVNCLATLDQGVAGLRIGVLREGFAIPGMSEPQVDALVKAAVAQLESLGASVGEASAPWHTGVALDLWNVIATDGAAYQMLQGNGYGMNVDGYYDPDIMSYFGEKRREHADALSSSVQAVALTGHYSLKNLHGAYYAKARMLIPELTRQYDEAFKDFDVLVMPTMPFVATPLTAADAPVEEYVHSALDMLANTAPFDLTGHPATSIPAGLADGLPVAMMIVAPRFQDALALRVAQAYEHARGAFPKPPAL